MSTNFSLIETGQADLEITEASAKFDVGMNFETEQGRVNCEIEGLTAEQVVDAALKMLNVVLYSYPEQWPIIVDKLRQLMY